MIHKKLNLITLTLHKYDIAIRNVNKEKVIKMTGLLYCLFCVRETTGSAGGSKKLSLCIEKMSSFDKMKMVSQPRTKIKGGIKSK